MVRPPTTIPSCHRALPSPTTRLFHTSTPSRSALFNLGGLAASREGQYLSRERGIPRTEYSSNIHLIRASEVDPFAPAPGAARHANAALERAESLRARLGQERERLRRFPQAAAAREALDAADEFRRHVAEQSAAVVGASSVSSSARLAEGAVQGLVGEVELLRAAVRRLQERDAAHKTRVFWLSTFVSLLAGTTTALWYSMRSETAAAAPAPAAAIETLALDGVADAETTGVGKALELPAAPVEDATIQTVRQDERARGLLESLFWSSRQGR